jgi:ParB-like chromosome segregation protein Spo0J
MTKRPKTTTRIDPALEPLTVPLSNLTSLKGNPRKGDVAAVARSYETFGQRKPIVARRTGENSAGPTGEVIAGNHQLAAAKKLKWERIAVVWTDDDELTAKAYALADNRTAELGSYDLENLAEMANAVSADAELMKATAWTTDDLAKILSQGEPAAPSAEEQALPEGFAVIVYCEDEDQQAELLNRFLGEGLNVKGLVS